MIRALRAEDRDWLRAFMIENWGSTQMVYSLGVHELDRLPGFVAMRGEEPVGLLTYAVRDGEYEVVSLDSMQEGQGIGSALMAALEEQARADGAKRVWLITTNDNLHALKFYQKRGYHLVRVLRDAVADARKIKPQIPLVGNDGIPIRDEVELEKRIGEK